MLRTAISRSVGCRPAVPDRLSLSGGVSGCGEWLLAWGGTGWWVEWFDGEALEVLVDERGAYVGDVGVLGDVVEHEPLQVAGVSHGDQDQEVVAAGDHEQRQGLGAGDDEVAEGGC